MKRCSGLIASSLSTTRLRLRAQTKAPTFYVFTQGYNKEVECPRPKRNSLTLMANTKVFMCRYVTSEVCRSLMEISIWSKWLSITCWTSLFSLWPGWVKLGFCLTQVSAREQSVAHQHLFPPQGMPALSRHCCPPLGQHKSHQMLLEQPASSAQGLAVVIWSVLEPS